MEAALRKKIKSFYVGFLGEYSKYQFHQVGLSLKYWFDTIQCSAVNQGSIRQKSKRNKYNYNNLET